MMVKLFLLKKWIIQFIFDLEITSDDSDKESSDEKDLKRISLSIEKIILKYRKIKTN